ncbi:MAG: hypothetical protein ABIQ58_07495 [Candidatus Limnocylindrales bacterium]
MDPRTAATRVPDLDAIEFVRFCYRRRRVGWPEIYDEMCAVAARGLFRGYDTDDLAAHGVGFALFDMAALAGLARRVVDEEKALRRPVSVVIIDAIPGVEDDHVPVMEPAMAAEPAAVIDLDVRVVPARERAPEHRIDRTFEREPEVARETPIRFQVVPVPAGA